MYKLYGRRGSGSVGPHMVLEELGVDYAFVHLEREEMKAPAYLELNPLGTVPVLMLENGTPMLESAAMIVHLTAAHASALAPRPGSVEHARFLQWMVYLSANVYEAYLRCSYSDRYSTGGATHAGAIKAKAEADLIRHFTVIEGGLDPYLLGASVSAADHYLHMLATWWVPAPSELYRRFPKLGALATAIEARPAVQRVLAANS